MSTTQISLAILSGLSVLVLATAKWRNKDTKGAITLIWIVFALGALLVISGCTIQSQYRPLLEVGMHYQPDRPVYGRNPVGTVRVKQPFWVADSSCNAPAAYVEYEHHSSIRDNNDLTTTDQVGLMFRIPLGRTK